MFARKALLATGWADGVRIVVDDGLIQSLDRAERPQADDLELGIVIPGLANAHSHAFQRVLAGHTEQRGPADKDTFWTWRKRMYQLADVVDADRLTAIARQAYTEMLKSGYTSVAEFHYLHSEPAARDAGDAMMAAIFRAAADSGIRLTYVPILYERAGFDEPLPTRQQSRFAKSLKEFLAHYSRARELHGRHTVVGIGAHCRGGGRRRSALPHTHCRTAARGRPVPRRLWAAPGSLAHGEPVDRREVVPRACHAHGSRGSRGAGA
jgi:formimidoylglutamate deiminase